MEKAYEELVAQLEERTRELAKANEIMEREIAERKRKEEELIAHRHHLDVLVRLRTDELTRANTRLLDEIAERKRLEESIQESSAKYEAIVEAFDGLIYICSANYEVEYMNRRMLEQTGYKAIGEKCHKVLHNLDAICPWCVNDRVFMGETVRWEVLSPKDNRWYYVINTPIRRTDGRISKMAMLQDITERKRFEEQTEALIHEIEKAIADVKILRGLFPLCPLCKRIRDDKGYWNQIETYIKEHSEADFNHSICPDCREKSPQASSGEGV